MASRSSRGQIKKRRSSIACIAVVVPVFLYITRLVFVTTVVDTAPRTLHSTEALTGPSQFTGTESTGAVASAQLPDKHMCSEVQHIPASVNVSSSAVYCDAVGLSTKADAACGSSASEDTRPLLITGLAGNFQETSVRLSC